MNTKTIPPWLAKLRSCPKSKLIRAQVHTAGYLKNWLTVSKCRNLPAPVIEAMLFLELTGTRRQAIIINRLHGWLREPLCMRKNQDQRLAMWRWLAANGKLSQENTNDGSALRKVRKEMAGARGGKIPGAKTSSAKLPRV